MEKERVIVGISGASGAILGIRLLEVLSKYDLETHLVLSDAGKRTIELETNWKIKEVEALATKVHDFTNIGSSIASGSFKTKGMIIIPCSIKTLSAIAYSFNTNLLIRAADVVLKERRKLVLVLREMPLAVSDVSTFLYQKVFISMKPDALNSILGAWAKAVALKARTSSPNKHSVITFFISFPPQ